MNTNSLKELVVWSVWVLLALIFLVGGNLFVIRNWPYGMLILSTGVGGMALSGVSLFPKLWSLRSKSAFFPVVIALFSIGILSMLCILPRHHDYFFMALSAELMGVLLLLANLLRSKWPLILLPASYGVFLFGFLAYRERLPNSDNWLLLGSSLLVLSLLILLIQLLHMWLAHSTSNTDGGQLHEGLE